MHEDTNNDELSNVLTGTEAKQGQEMHEASEVPSFVSLNERFSIMPATRDEEGKDINHIRFMVSWV